MYQNKAVYLASASPRRKEILTNMGLEVHLLQIAIDETPKEQELPSDYVLRMAREKNNAAQRLFNHDNSTYPIISSDTAVIIDNQILGKPIDKNDACDMLKKLSGKTHQVLTSISVYYQGKQQDILQSNEILFKTLSAEEIQRYLATEEPYDKAGAYAIQGYAAMFIAHLSGSFTGVMGLPVFELMTMLNDYLFNELAQNSLSPNAMLGLSQGDENE